MKKRCLLLALLVSYAGSCCAASQQELELIESHAENIPGYVLSFPRSGNTWLRYCIEYLTGIPTCTMPVNRHTSIDQPLGIIYKFYLDLHHPPLVKVHDRVRIQELSGDNLDTVKLIFIIRNPKEAMIRHGGGSLGYRFLQGEGAYYFDNIALYDSWNPENRFLIYYEDLLTNPEPILRDLLAFLGKSAEGVDAFMQEIEMHKKRGIEVYGTSMSQGKDLLFHSKQLTTWRRKDIDHWIAELYPEQWEKYLKDRYSEKSVS